jgi:hypothetical protein
MSDSKDEQRAEADAELERKIRKGRKFTLAEAIGRMAGPGAMKGASPVAQTEQAAMKWLPAAFVRRKSLRPFLGVGKLNA